MMLFVTVVDMFQFLKMVPHHKHKSLGMIGLTYDIIGSTISFF